MVPDTRALVKGRQTKLSTTYSAKHSATTSTGYGNIRGFDALGTPLAHAEIEITAGFDHE